MIAKSKSGAGVRIWVLLDTVAGHRNQALGVAEALGLPFERIDLSYGPLAKLPNAIIGARSIGITPPIRQQLMMPPWPDLVIAAGRRTAPIARAIRRESGRRTRLVHLMHPGAGVSEFDLIAVPRHDSGRRTANMIETIGAPHRVNNAILAEAHERWRPELEPVARPRIAVMVGGSTRRRTFTMAMGQDLAHAARAVAEETGGQLMVSTSRRSGDGGVAFLAEVAELIRYMYLWGLGGDNPYLGLLAWADRIIVTGDSVSMCAEAAGVGVPVHIFGPEKLLSTKHQRMMLDLAESGLAQPIGGALAPVPHPPHNPAVEIATLIRDRILP